MRTHDFIFSDHAGHRIMRHVAFWLVWWFFFIFTYYFPHFWFLDWRFEQAQVSLTQQVGYLRFAEFVIINTFLGNISSHLLFTYPILYFLMPRFLYKKKYQGFAIGILVLTLLITVFTYYKLLWYYNPLLAYFGIPPLTDPQEFIWFCIWTQVLFNCPTVAGLATGIKLFKYYYLKEREIEQVAKEKAKAELQLLRSQVHPHFLFNTLNNIYYFTLTSLEKAPAMIKKLSGLLQYMLNECDRPMVPLEREIKMIQDYMTLEKIRYGDNLNMNVVIEGDPTNKLITPLLLIPFVENSFKHGTSKMLAHPWVNLHIHIEEEALTFSLKNSKPDNHSSTAPHGIGLNNVTKRLQLLYPDNHILHVAEDLISFSISLKIKVMSGQVPEDKATSIALSYELA